MANFDFEKTLKEYPCSKMLKKGFLQYITDNGIQIKSNKEFEKIINEYFNLKQ